LDSLEVDGVGLIEPWSSVKCTLPNGEKPTGTVVIPAKDSDGHFVFVKFADSAIAPVDLSCVIGIVSTGITQWESYDHFRHLTLAEMTKVVKEDLCPVVGRSEEEEMSAALLRECNNRLAALTLPGWIEKQGFDESTEINAAPPFNIAVGDRIFRWIGEDLEEEVTAVVAAIFDDGGVACLPARCQKIQYWEDDAIAGPASYCSCSSSACSCSSSMVMSCFPVPSLSPSPSASFSSMAGDGGRGEKERVALCAGVKRGEKERATLQQAKRAQDAFIRTLSSLLQLVLWPFSDVSMYCRQCGDCCR
jgi:hypothetical protein